MTSNTITVGELIYEVIANFTKVTEYGVSMEALVSGRSTPPPEGARIDVAEDNEKIAFFADGAATPEERTGLYQLRDKITLTTSSPAYSWVNSLQFWGIGTVDPVKRQANVKVYAA